MAKKGVEINVAMNATEVQKGAKDVEESFEKVADALDDVAKEADQAGRRMGDDIEDGAKDAEKAVDRLERSFKQMADGAKRESAQAGNSMKRDMRDGADGAGEAVREFGDEAKQNVAETFSSFRGEAEDFAQIAQDTFGGVISNLGPVGMAAGAAGAIGIGLIMGSLEEGSEEAEEMRQRISDLAAEFIETGGIGQASLDGVVERLKELATTTEEGRQNLAQLYADSDSAVTGFKRLADAYAGNEDQLQKLIDAERERQDVLQKTANADKGWDREASTRKQEQLDAQKRIVAGLEDAQEAAEGAAEAEAAWLASNGPYYEARVEQLDAIQGELDKTLDSYTEFVDKESGAINPAAYIEGMAARREAISNFNSNVQQLTEQFSLSFEEQQAILDKGLDFAPHLQSIMDSGFSEAYVNEVRASVDGAQSIIDGQPIVAPVKTETDTSDAEAQLDAAAGERTAPIEVKADPKPAERQIDAAATKKRTALIDVRASTTEAERQLDRLANAHRTATIYADVIERPTRKYDW